MNKSSDENWVSIKKVGLPELRLVAEDDHISVYATKKVLIQDDYERLFVACCRKVCRHKEGKDETCWYTTYGTKIEDEVVAWMELPKKYDGE